MTIGTVFAPLFRVPIRFLSIFALVLVLAGCGGAGTHSQTIMITPVSGSPAVASPSLVSTP